MNTRNLQMASNKVRDIERYFYTTLGNLYSEGEIRQFLLMLSEAFLGWDTVAYMLHRDDTINQSDLLRFHWAAEDLRKERPIQQIIGWTTFCNCKINVNEHTLIPRPETEEITEKLSSHFQGREGLNLLDLCTGSGCIAIALAHRLKNAHTIGIDISVEALKVAQPNAHQNNAEVTFICCDILKEIPPLPYNQFHLIVSNPPYIGQSERQEMHRNVLDYEPASALFVEDHDPLIFYRNIAQYASQHLTEDGLLAFEINEKYGNEMLQLLSSLGFDSNLHKDFRGKDRMVLAHLRITA